MNIENTKAQMRKGILEMSILAIVARGEAYPSDIIKALKDMDLIIVEGTLYPLLTRLKNYHLLDYRWEESNSGPPRKYFSLTDEGQRVYLELKEAWQDFVICVNNIIK
jgi:PadR family transcriptional regulator PadR